MTAEDEIRTLLLQLETHVSDQIGTRLLQIARDLDASVSSRVSKALAERIYLPPLPLAAPAAPPGPFMRYSTCSAADFFHPRYAEICALFGQRPNYTRKIWEWVFIIHKLLEAGMLNDGKRGVVFGVGKERLPALFAKLGCEIVATDAPPDLQSTSGWAQSAQHASSLDELRWPEGIANELLERRVTHRYCDMRSIDEDLTGFDFTWSSCCFEHLGSLEAGMQFVIDSVEKTLKIGGVACHTTEYNLSSNEETLTGGTTVIYRARDIEELVGRLRQRCHEVEPFVIAPDAHPLDFHVDAPPYSFRPHLKLLLGQFVATSVGVMVRRGR